jgi:hypothetical protein
MLILEVMPGLQTHAGIRERGGNGGTRADADLTRRKRGVACLLRTIAQQA